MKPLQLGIVVTVVVLSGLGANYLYHNKLSEGAATAQIPAGAEAGSKKEDKKDKVPVSRVAQTVQTWPSDKPPVTTAAEPAAAPAGDAPAETPAPAPADQAASAPPVESGSAPAAEPAPQASAASQQPDQRDRARAETAQSEHQSQDSRTAQTALLASGGEHPSKPPAAAAASTEDAGGGGTADQAQSPPVEVEQQAAPAAGAPAASAPAKGASPKAAVKAKAGDKIVAAKPAATGTKANAGRPFDATTSWWPAVGHEGGGLCLTYAGEAAFDKAIVLLFSKPVSVGSASQLRLLDGKGEPATGNWSVSPKNPQMLIGKVPSGRYLVSIPAEFTDAAGDKLGSTLQGPVYVH